MYKNHLENIDSKKLLFVNTFTSTLLIASIAFIFYHFIFHGYYLDSAWPKNSFFQKPEIIGNDFSRMVDVSSSLDPYSNMRRVFLNEANPYSLLSYIYFYLLSLLNLFTPMQLLYTLHCVIFILVFLLINLKYFRIKEFGFTPVFIATFLSFPFLYLLDRGNIESLLFILTYFGLYFYYHKNNLYLSSVFLILATAFKPYYGIFFTLYIFDKKYKEFFYSLIAGILLLLFCSIVLNGDLKSHISGFMDEVKLISGICFSYKYNCNNLSLKIPFSFNSSFFFNVFCVFLFASTMIFHYFFKFKRWQMLLMLCLLTYFIPIMSYTYKLITLFIPIYYLIDDIKYESVKSIKSYGIIFGLLLSCIYISHGFQYLFLKSILILTYFLLISDRFKESELFKSKISYLKKIFTKKWKQKN